MPTSTKVRRLVRSGLSGLTVAAILMWFMRLDSSWV